LDVLLFEAPPPIPIRLRVREQFEGFLGAVVVHIAQRHYVLVLEDVVVRSPAAPYADEGHVQLITRSVLTAQCAALQNEQTGAGAGGAKEVASLHGKSVARSSFRRNRARALPSNYAVRACAAFPR